MTADPPPLKWSGVMFGKTEAQNGYEAAQAGRDCHVTKLRQIEVLAGQVGLARQIRDERLADAIGQSQKAH